MNYSGFSTTSRCSTWLKFASASLIALAVAGCGGGSDGAAGPAGSAGPTGPAGPAGSTAVAGATIASNATPATATAAAAWKALAPQVTVESVTINSPPVVNFSVKDANGKPVVGLGNTSQKSTDVVPGLTNLAFTLAKLVPGTNNEPSKWVSYLVTNPVFNADKSGVDWAGGFPTYDKQGTLVDNGDGSYQYTFYRDIKQAAATVAGLTDDAAAFKFKADLGDVSFDATLTHRLGIQIGGAAPGTGSNNPAASSAGMPASVNMVNTANVVYDFRPDGQPVTNTRDIVKIDSCSSCHDGKVLAHGSRKDPKYCVTCHTDQIKYSFNAGEASSTNGGLTLNGTTRPTTAIVGGRAVGNFPNMIHKTHMGDELVKQGYFFNAAGEGKYNEFALPQSPANCTTCHSGSDTAANKTANGDNWKNVPSLLACGACHDGINFATGGGVTLADMAKDVAAKVAVGTTQSGHVGGAKADNATCVLCHSSTDITTYHQLTVASQHNPVVKAGIARFEYKLTGVTINASKQLVAKFQVLKDDQAIALPAAGFTGGPSFLVVYATGQDGIVAPSDWNSKHDSVALDTLLAAGAAGDANGNMLTLDAATNTYTATLAYSTAGRSAAHTLAIPADAKMVTAMMAGGFTDAKANSLPGIPAMMAATGNTPDGKANVARRVIFKEAKCNSCHDRLGTSPNFHGGNYSIAMCAACHTPIQGGSTGWSASFRVWVHGIHSAEKRTVPFTWHAVSATETYATLGYPGVLKDCKQCHEAGTYDFSAKQYTDALVGSMLNVTAASGIKVLSSNYVIPQAAPVGSGQIAYGLTSGADYGTGTGIDTSTGLIIDKTTNPSQENNLVSSPITAVCSSCHDSAAAIGHFKTNNGSFYDPRSLAVTKTEACLTCHGPGKIAAIADAHSK